MTHANFILKKLHIIQLPPLWCDGTTTNIICFQISRHIFLEKKYIATDWICVILQIKHIKKYEAWLTMKVVKKLKIYYGIKCKTEKQIGYAEIACRYVHLLLKKIQWFSPKGKKALKNKLPDPF